MAILQLAGCNALLGRDKVRLYATDLFDSAGRSIFRNEISENPTNLLGKLTFSKQTYRNKYEIFTFFRPNALATASTSSAPSSG